MSLQVGDLAPNFSLCDAQAQEVELAQLRGHWVVLYFYPRDLTPGCTKEACGFRDTYSQYQARQWIVLGISADEAQTHAKFATKHQLPFPLLCDREAQVAAAYGCYGLKKFMGKEFMGIHRTTFIINPEGKIARIYRKMKPELHAGEILQDFPVEP
ncbi:thioredoxin-dependent thiol peroxidase [Desertifilum sp. FACHB-1129]|uniref:thioredoxin-dependent peroxiredoxin n=3 Tax=Cyanophyceae TaxID=3028117 RepID=A0A1E5QCM1_9CYAN|nr:MULTISPECIES: thioredoxin-dependent thiol peroxidase [Cyanophyceae]MCD8488479.1 thioredoxin-dependent thiol peroxidase [Desertifilum sp.]MDA0211652.1 thioredoxin-dependent thiol peroxidase [Cyanobacteria bacterium FC1]MDL5045191.1 thioredoxin-dependent thiol peroxidase [Oscillatoria amoena NRMC-F 0135]MBD2312159.1 thioredoxin-dependent thiol peroxidase [Desertifilum sp. FACHB-1129]MBD2322179.1 thioredoxin-dependent thiol peroxidase [Desertifilum sp. FACHB-866]